MGAGALLAASILPAVSVFAVDPLDYAKSVGSIGGADTINWVVEATSDGGYVVGGQTMGCYRHEDGVALASAHADNDDGELVEWSKCEEYYSNMPMSTFEAKGKRNISIMDISDAVNGILLINDISLVERHHTYNLGPGTQYSILDYAESVNNIGREFGFPLVNILIKDNGKESAICMDCSRLMKQTAWHPSISKEKMIFSLFKKYIV